VGHGRHRHGRRRRLPVRRAATTTLAMATLYALRNLRSSVIYPLRLDSAGLEITLKEPDSRLQDTLEVLRRHGITVRTVDAEIDEERTCYKPKFASPTPQRPSCPGRALQPP
jgi:hypothetical protein